MNPEWIRDLTIEDLPESYQQVAEIVGIEKAVELSRYLGGLSFYFPKIEALVIKKRDDAIRREFNGANHKELAIKYKLTEQWIRQIVQNGRDDRQISFF